MPDMPELETVVKDLRANATRLVDKYNAAQQKNRVLKEQLDELRTKLESHQDDVSKLREENKMMQLAGSVGGDGSREIKLRINELVREIDKCIAQLNH